MLCASRSWNWCNFITWNFVGRSKKRSSINWLKLCWITCSDQPLYTHSNVIVNNQPKKVINNIIHFRIFFPISSLKIICMFFANYFRCELRSNFFRVSSFQRNTDMLLVLSTGIHSNLCQCQPPSCIAVWAINVNLTIVKPF